MNKEEYKKIKLESIRNFINLPPFQELRLDDVESFLSQTIDDLWKLPERKSEDTPTDTEVKTQNRFSARVSWNACIAEAERMRDLSIKVKI